MKKTASQIADRVLKYAYMTEKDLYTPQELASYKHPTPERQLEVMRWLDTRGQENRPEAPEIFGQSPMTDWDLMHLQYKNQGVTLPEGKEHWYSRQLGKTNVYTPSGTGRD